MEDRRHTEPWRSAQPAGAAPIEDVEETIKHARPPTRTDTDERLRGMSIDGRYRIGDCIGSGGMSRVYSGVHTGTGVRVAIKLIDPALSRDPATKQRLLGEARAMMELQSSHIVRAHDVGTIQTGQLYVVMELLDGENLDVLLTREGPLSWPRVAAIGVQICNGLATAHRSKIVHRDIKPQNLIRVAVDGNPEHIKIIDFGVAREVRVEAGPTEQGVLPGTPEYMAPELVLNRGVRANERTDLYAVGVTLYKLVTGRLPFQGATYMETLRRHVAEPLTPPSAAAPTLNIPPEADALLAKLLAKDPEARFASADQLAAALRTDRRTPPPAAVQPPNRRAPLKTPNKRDLLPSPSSFIPAETVGTMPSVTPAEITEPPRPNSRALDSRFLLLRLTALIVVSALFTVGTFAIRPRAEEPKPTIAAKSAAKKDVAPRPQPAPVVTPDPTPPPDEAKPTDTVAPVEIPPTDQKPVDPPPVEPIAEPTAVEPPPADPPTVETPPAEPPPVIVDPPNLVDPEQPPEPLAAPEPAAPAAPPEPKFGYASARTMIEEQHAYMRNECMGKKPSKPLARLKFRADVRPDGRANIRVFSSEKEVRNCVRELFRVPFDESPAGGAFEYTLTATAGNLKAVALDPEKVK